MLHTSFTSVAVESAEECATFHSRLEVKWLSGMKSDDVTDDEQFERCTKREEKGHLG